MSPTWTILVPTLGQRSAQLKRLLDVLLPQLEPYGSRAQVVAFWNNGEYALTCIRQTLVMATETDYLCFMDDDDLPPAYYVQEVMRALEYDPDYVGWIVECAHPRRQSQLAYHSLQHGGWFQRDNKLYRDYSHVNPIRTSIARRVDFRYTPRYRPEDRYWAAQLRRLRAARREVYIDRIMYHYLYVPGESDSWRSPRHIKRGRYERLSVSHPNFRWYTGSMLSEHTHPSRLGERRA